MTDRNNYTGIETNVAVFDTKILKHSRKQVLFGSLIKRLPQKNFKAYKRLLQSFDKKMTPP